MTDDKLNKALVEKNDQDFNEVTKRLEDALSQIEKNPKLKPSQQVLAKVSGL